MLPLLLATASAAIDAERAPGGGTFRHSGAEQLGGGGELGAARSAIAPASAAEPPPAPPGADAIEMPKVASSSRTVWSTPDGGVPAAAGPWKLRCSDDSEHAGLGGESLFSSMLSLSALECKLVQQPSPSPLAPLLPAAPPGTVVSRGVVTLQPRTFAASSPASTAAVQHDVAPTKARTTRRLTTLVDPGVDTLQAAYDAASAGDELELKDGTYTSSSGDNVLEISIHSMDVSIRAQNAGMAILDGENARRGVHISGGTVVLEGLAITKGTIAGHGGGLKVSGSCVVTLNNCDIHHNEAVRIDGTDSGSGGGIYVGTAGTDFPLVTLDNCGIHHNTASSYFGGGGLFIYGAQYIVTVVTLNNCDIHNNEATYTTTSCPGVFISGGDVAMSDTTIRTNYNTRPDGSGAAAVDFRSSTQPTTPWSNVTFIDNDKSLVATTPMGWSCPLGKYMPETGQHDGDFVGCPHDCFPGFYGDSPIDVTDGQCSGKCWRGHYCPGATSTPIPCDEGTYLPVNGSQGKENCIPCFPGSFSTVLGNPTSCSPCPAGTYSAALGSTSCTECPKGGYCASEGAASEATAFTECPAGTYNPDRGSSSSDDCRACPTGKANPVPGRDDPDVCIPCLPGAFAFVEGEGVCDQCPAGTYADGHGSTVCRACEGGYCPNGTSIPISCEVGAGLAHTEVERQGATGRESCVCKPGYYALPATDGEDTVTCKVCPSGTHCAAAGTTLWTLPVARGFYRTSADSIDLRRCPDGAQSTSGCRGTAQANSTTNNGGARRLQASLPRSDDGFADGCAPGLHHIFCQACLPRDDGRLAFYVPATTSSVAFCEACSETVLVAAAVTLGAALLVLLLLIIVGRHGLLDGLLNCGLRSLLSEREAARLALGTEQLIGLVRALSPHIKFKILLGFYLIAVKVPTLYRTLPALSSPAAAVHAHEYACTQCARSHALHCRSILSTRFRCRTRSSRCSTWFRSPLALGSITLAFRLRAPTSMAIKASSSST